MVVAVAALAGAAIGWRFPFLGRSRTANQLQTAQQPRVVQPANRTRVQRASQPNPQALNDNQTTAQAPATAQAPDAITNPDATDAPPANNNQPIPALW